MTALPPDGLFAFPLTPFSVDGERLDLGIFREHLERLLGSSPDGIFVAGGTGEFTALSLTEYIRLTQAAVETVAGRVPVYAGVGGGPGVARDFARAAAEAGVDGGLLLPPYLVSSTPAGLLRHVEFVAADGDLPLVVYQRATARLDAPTAVRLLDLPTVVGIKDGLGDLDLIQRIVTAVRTSGHSRAGEFCFLNGLPTAELSARAYTAVGVSGYSSAVLDCVPELSLGFRAALRSGDDEVLDRLLAEFFLPFAALRDRVPGYAVALVKAGARLAGLAVGGVRPPLVDPPEEHVDELGRIIARGKAALT